MGGNLRRHHITLGAMTTVGGKVVSASSSMSIGGRSMALEGDQVLCPACRSTGRIVCTEPRVPEIWNGRKWRWRTICASALVPSHRN
ncbi:PAAR domain-containing protein [Pseudoduganella flava]|uniref:PAAR domain-containing protein n=1 Tax=Pseudoduganella flava TaxID=871742 RepID=UPI0027D9B489|nr:PAAR domain-containing protein [Pseudoduganella flava]